MPETDHGVNFRKTTRAMLRDFQVTVKHGIYEAWAEGAYNVMPVMPTGSGKTVLFCDIVREFDRPACLIAHRQELVAQAALALNRERVPHAIIAPKPVIEQIIALENETHGYSLYSSRAQVRCAGVDTIIKRDASDRWYSQVGLVVQDEGHHVLRENKWGRAQSMFPNARGLFPTAQAVRADGKGLGRDSDGLVDRLVVGPCGRDLINRGFLTDYDIYCPEGDIDFDSELQNAIGPSGEFKMPVLRAVTHKSKQLVGNVVRDYLNYAPGKLGITFAVDIEEAKKYAAAFRKSDIPAEIITAETPIIVRGKLMRKFRERELLQLISVDCLGEGVDVPAVEVISMARATASWQVLCQQFGRPLRVFVDGRYWEHWDTYTDDQRIAIIGASDKPRAIVIDHVGNIIWHAKSRGLPDSRQQYSTNRRESVSRSKSDAIPLRPCLNCHKPYERYHVACPYCKHVPEPVLRNAPEQVDGDVILLSPEVLRAMRGEIDKVNGPVVIPKGVSAAARVGILRNHHDRYAAQQSLQRVMHVWGGWQLRRGLSDREMSKLFYIRYGIDVMSAQALGTADATALEARIRAELEKHNIVEAIAA